MHHQGHTIKLEYQQAVRKVLHYVNQNILGDVSLETLAGIANYSPFHFQKIFSDAISESPKQYVMRLRLERAAHYLKVFPNLPVVEIAIGCGFSSASIFSRAFKKYYSVNAQVFREMSAKEISKRLKLNIKNTKHLSLEMSNIWINNIIDPMDSGITIQISPPPIVKMFQSIKIAYIQTTLNHPESISFAFKSLIKWAIPQGIIAADTRYIGIWLDVPFYTSPDKCRYLAGIELTSEIKSKKDIDVLTMHGGKYTFFNSIGTLEFTLNQMIALNHHYLSQLGYEIAEIICYEIFDECPAYKQYDLIQKTILVPVKTPMNMY